MSADPIPGGQDEADVPASALLAAIVDSSEDAIISTTLDGVVTGWNRSAELVFGYCAAEMVGRSHSVLNAPGQPDDPSLILEQLRRGEPTRAYETSRRIRDGRVVSVSLSVAPIRDANGAVIGAVTLARTLAGSRCADSERERAGAESENPRRFLEAALASTSDLVYVFGLDHRLAYANDALLRIWGRTAEEAIGRNCLELGYEPWHAERHDREIEQVIATGRPVRGEAPFTGAGGCRVYDSLLVPVLGREGDVVAVAGAARDVTERRQAEEGFRHEAERLREEDRRKDEFLAVLAHELRNPLAAIANAVNLTKFGARQEHIDWAMNVINRQLKHLTRLIDDLMDASRISRGKIELRRQVLDATGPLESAAATVRSLIEERKHTLELSLERGNLWLSADPTRLEQVVVNLLNNAVKYSEDGGVIRLQARNEGDEVVITVIDRGVGIAPELLPRIFEIFAQGDRSRARREGGLGIGLSVVKKLVEMHGGTVKAHSAGPSLGSEFTIRLPRAARPVPVEGEANQSPRARASARVLVVDDNQDAARSMSRLLQLVGHEVALAYSGPEALDVARTYHPEFILLDIGLPGMDGYEVASRLRQEERCKDAVIIAVSGYGQDEDRRRARDAGCDHHLVKPVDDSALLALLAPPP